MAAKPVLVDASPVGHVFGACASEAQLLSASFARLEAAILRSLDDAGIAHVDSGLQEALQDMDSIAQHIETLRFVLDGAARVCDGDSVLNMLPTLEAVRLSVVADRLTGSLTGQTDVGAPPPSGDVEIL